jgi:hypothetical protein
VQRSTGSWPFRPVRTGYPARSNPYEWCSDAEPPLTDIPAMQAIDIVVLGTLAVTGYSVFWVVRHELAVRRLRSQPPS